MNEIQLKTSKLLGEIQTLAYMVNTTTDYCVFAEFHGHVNSIEVRISETKRNCTDWTRRGTYLPPNDDWFNDGEMLVKLENIKTELNQLLQTKEAKSI